MHAARVIGRFGGLPIVLGIGTAVLGGGGIAWADGAQPDSGNSESSTGTAQREAMSSTARPQAIAVPRTPTARTTTTKRRHHPTLPTRIASRTTVAVPQGQSGTLSVDPKLSWQDGILRGTVGATSSEDVVFQVVAPPSLGGKFSSDILNQPLFGPEGEFSYLPYGSALTDSTQTEAFSILVSENTLFDRTVTGIPLLGLLAGQVLQLLHRIPVVNDVLSPVIGESQIVTFTVNPSAEAAGRPTAFTYLVRSFDATPISLNYFPALDVIDSASAPTVLLGPGLPGAGDTNPDEPVQFSSLTPGIPVLRSGMWISPDSGPAYHGDGGYNVITWDPRGEYASGGVLQFDNPFYEGRDVSSIISWATSDINPARSQIRVDEAGDPLIGMVGGSYGGGIQLTAAGIDPRIDAIVPELAWTSLLSSLYPNDNQFKTGLSAGLVIALVITRARVNPQLYEAVLTGTTFGSLSQTSQAVLASSGPTVLLNQLHSPTMYFQGTVDTLFPLGQAMLGAQAILANPYDVPVKMVWFCGGHGTCLDPLNPYQDDLGFIDNLRWLDQYVGRDSDRPADDIPVFQWYDQRGVYWSSDLLPFEQGFNNPVPYRTAGTGGLLGIVPLLGGSGPGSLDEFPFFLSNGTRAWNAINLDVTPPAGSQIVGAPELSFTYTGLGTSRTVYAQLLDDITGRVLGNIVTPVPVILDGSEHSASIPMEAIAFTAGTSDSLTLQITSSASNFANFTSFGVIGISDITLDLPIRAGAPS